MSSKTNPRVRVNTCAIVFVPNRPSTTPRTRRASHDGRSALLQLEIAGGPVCRYDVVMVTVVVRLVGQ